MTDSSVTVRLDLWLWAARFFKNRTLSRQAIETGKVEVDGQRPKVSRAVRIDDVLRVTRGEETFEVTVLALASKRGSATVAQGLYRESEESKLAREEASAMRAAARVGYEAPRTKPDKRARRLIRALGDIDAL
ncbi:MULTISPECIES: RNA-binding S4 domain-containing protein [Lysobacteraceae]|uniref:RNA-binding S4 domain-containing protein n=1 Tax=Novilysobacter avium TaxID=2781023 RepID=A0A7S6UM67_9GAMM|nr:MULTISPECIES: RNA-binding S4 domain-containing protein [Lysobacter]QOW22821.1 RNA-binding S4 domain-containing protein [Lysobacter avium]QOW25331.1 RNA-binding S4 domain-containing protein [Lysobacter sp. H23M47]